MSTDLIERARSGDEEAFRELVDPYRRELQLHCYRLLGSLHDAEDGVQETLLAAWQGLRTFEGRSSIRTWLYKIATSRCLNLLRAAHRRGRPDIHHLGPGLPEPTRPGEVLWLEPYPDELLAGVPDTTPGPDARYEAREAVALAFVTALQLLPPRQRAVQILRDVLGYRAKEVARMLNTTEESVASAHKRARATLRLRLPSADPALRPLPPKSAAEYALAERFTTAFEAGDVDGVVSLLTEDVSFTMPPLPFAWEGHDRASQFLVAMWHEAPVRRLVPTRANGQPAFCLYVPGPDHAVLRAMGVLVLTLAGDRIAAITRFGESVLPYFGLARTIEDAA
ncbi:MAG TPA: RNA polymerase subunit sigma-70 [Thermomicrobiales bacterium]|nr:RNA polymerase subunit sigma-70 [Thermomicrobiales bacterium]